MDNLKEQKVLDIHKELDKIVLGLDEYIKSGKALHEVELPLFSYLFSLGLQLLKYYIFSIHLLVKAQGAPLDQKGERMINKGLRSYQYQSVFGILTVQWSCYYNALGGYLYYPLDKY